MIFILIKTALDLCQVFFAVLKLPPCPCLDAPTGPGQTGHYRNPVTSRSKSFMLDDGSSSVRSGRVGHESPSGKG